MSTGFKILTGCTDGGLAASQPVDYTPTLLAAPAFDSGKNTFRDALIPLACWRLDDIRFGSDDSFLAPETASEFRVLNVLLADHPKAPLSVFGHTDPVARDDYSKTLSGRRAAVVYGVLTRNTDLWESIYSSPAGADDWGLRSVQTMLNTLGYSPGAIDGNDGPNTRKALQRFQRDNGLPSGGMASQDTREKLFRAYMDVLCVDQDGNPWQLAKTDFLARGADPDGKGDYQGCGEFNPDLMFSQTDNNDLSAPEKKARRDAENSPNRRVVIFVFRPGSKVSVDRWPCPRAKEGVHGCITRFWSDADQRRQFQDESRIFEETHDTYACRFYHRVAGSSPCERMGDLYLFRLFDETAVAIPNARYEVEIGEARRCGYADQDGWIRIRAVELPNPCRIRWSRPDADPGTSDEPHWDYCMQVEIKIEGETAQMQRLHNLGYPFGTTAEERRVAFEKDYGASENTPATVEAWHRDANPNPRLLRRDQNQGTSNGRSEKK